MSKKKKLPFSNEEMSAIFSAHAVGALETIHTSELDGTSPEDRCALEFAAYANDKVLGVTTPHKSMRSLWLERLYLSGAPNEQCLMLAPFDLYYRSDMSLKELETLCQTLMCLKNTPK